jgi:hypothetical protein
MRRHAREPEPHMTLAAAMFARVHRGPDETGPEALGDPRPVAVNSTILASELDRSGDLTTTGRILDAGKREMPPRQRERDRPAAPLQSTCAAADRLAQEFRRVGCRGSCGPSRAAMKCTDPGRWVDAVRHQSAAARGARHHPARSDAGGVPPAEHGGRGRAHDLRWYHDRGPRTCGPAGLVSHAMVNTINLRL